MVRENGMVMMSETEFEAYANNVKHTNDKLRKAEYELDIAKMELATYHQTIREMAKTNLSKKGGDKVNGFEIPAKDFADMIDSVTNEALEECGEVMNKLCETDMWFVWNGFSARIPFGCEICNEVLPAIKDAYEEYNC